MKFIKYNDEHFYFFVNNYYIALKKGWIENGFNADYYTSKNIDMNDFATIISKEEINEHIEEIREKYPELLL